jgi:hypothetical protein
MVTDDSATQYSIQMNLNSKTTGIIHLLHFSLDKKIEDKYANVMRWQRKDERVTRDILRMKSTSKQLCLEHRSIDGKSMQKITLDLCSVMGCELSENTLTLDVFEAPILEVKDEKLWKMIQIQEVRDSPDKSVAFQSFDGPCRVHVVAKPIPFGINKPHHNFKNSLSKHPLLQNALKGGIQVNYQYVRQQNPHELFPLIQDPTLVRAAQLAVLTFLKENQGLQETIKLFSGLFLGFSSLLKKRIDNSNRKEE